MSLSVFFLWPLFAQQSCVSAVLRSTANLFQAEQQPLTVSQSNIGPKCVQKKDVNSTLCQEGFFWFLAPRAQRRAVNCTCMCVFALLSVLC